MDEKEKNVNETPEAEQQNETASATENENAAADPQNDASASGTDRQNEQKPAGDDTQKKVICALGYVFGILFFLPLVVYPNDEFAKFHANQSLVVLLFAVIGGVVFGILSLIPAVGIVFTILMYVFEVLILVLCILGIINAVKLEKKELPVIGRIRILK